MPILPESPFIFISYARRDKKYVEFIEPHLDNIKLRLSIEYWYDKMIPSGNDWRIDIDKSMSHAAAAIFLISEKFLASQNCIREFRYFMSRVASGDGVKIFPILVRPSTWHEDDTLRNYQLYPRDAIPLSVLSLNRREKVVNDIFKEINDSVKGVYDIPHLNGTGPDRDKITTVDASCKLDMSRLRQSGKYLHGRDEYIRYLNSALNDTSCRIVSLVAAGGLGKTTLVRHWLDKLKESDWSGIDKIYAWSFYGNADDAINSADEFIDNALRWFGETHPSTASVWDRGERLAELVLSHNTLLILDGLESLQWLDPGIPGLVRDPTLQKFIHDIASNGSGISNCLCVITSRLSLTPAEKLGASFIEYNLEPISSFNGAQILRSKGLDLPDSILEGLSSEFGNHTLSVTLAGTYLYRRGHLQSWQQSFEEIPPLPRGSSDICDQAKRLLDAFLNRFGDSAERELLYILGLFGRPFAIDDLYAVLSGPPIRYLTDHLKSMEREQILYRISELRKCRLIAPSREEMDGQIDTHPIIHQYLSDNLKDRSWQSWRDGHERLYEHYNNRTKIDYAPVNISKLQPLFYAVRHGCLAGRHSEVLSSVVRAKIRQGDKAIIVKNLGAISADLSVLANFFDVLWERPSQSLALLDQAFVLNAAGFNLRSMGVPEQAVPLIEKSMGLYVEMGDFEKASDVSTNLGGLLVTLARLEEAKCVSINAIEFSDKSQREKWKTISRATLGNALHQLGQVDEAERWFRDAELIQSNWQPSRPTLYNIRGFRYNDLLLSLDRYEDVIARSEIALQWARDDHESILDIALANLAMGRAYALAANIDVRNKQSHAEKAEKYLNESVLELRRSSLQQYLPRALLANASFYREQNALGRSRKFMDEALRIGRRGRMRLWIIDADIEFALLSIAERRPDAAYVPYIRAKNAIKETKYFRRSRDIDALSHQLDGNNVNCYIGDGRILDHVE